MRRVRVSSSLVSRVWAVARRVSVREGRRCRRVVFPLLLPDGGAGDGSGPEAEAGVVLLGMVWSVSEGGWRGAKSR